MMLDTHAKFHLNMTISCITAAQGQVVTPNLGVMIPERMVIGTTAQNASKVCLNTLSLKKTLRCIVGLSN